MSRPARPFDASVWLALGAALVVVLVTFREYGVAWDEQGETVFGTLLLRYYASGFHDHSAFDFVNFRFYGGGFELPAAVLSRVSPFGLYETRHLLSALLGLVGVAATWRLARRLGGPRAGALAALLLLLNPSFYGHLFINARDVPFAAGMTCCLLATLVAIDELPKIRFRTAAAFGVALGLTMSVRVGGLLAAFYLLAAASLWLLARARSGLPRAAVARDALLIARALVPSLAIAYALLIVFWPWAIQAPLNPLRALVMFSDFPFDGKVLFDGRLIPARSLPATYLPVLLAVKQPEVLLVGVAVALLAGAFALWKRPRAALDAQNLGIVTVVLAAVFPVLYFVVARPVAYNGMRHFLFVLPPLSVIAAMALDRALSAARWPSLRAAMVLALALAGAVQVRALIALHPDQYVYFNALVGGARGAQGRYELDYWGTSLAHATQQLVEELERRDARPKPGQSPFKVYVCGNVWSAATFFPPWLAPVDRIEDADYQIAIAQFYCKAPARSRRVLDVTRAGALLSFVDDL